MDTEQTEKIEHRKEGAGGSFVLKHDKNIAARLLYTRDRDTLVIDYVEVAPELRGRNLGVKMVDAAVAFARQEQLKVFPICSYARAVMERSKTYDDVWSA